MGFGDDIMASAEARRRQEAGDPRPCVYVDKHGRPKWSPVLDNNPRFVFVDPKLAAAELAGTCQVLDHRSGNRPYIDYAHSSRSKWAWKDSPPEPGEIYLSAAEHAAIPDMTPYIVIEPTLKAQASPNKDWGWHRWQGLATAVGVHRLIQLGPRGTRLLAGVRLRVTESIRDAFTALAGAELYVGHEGALHHAAAALGIPAVVIFGGYVSPRQTGYADLFGAGANRPVSPCAPAGARHINIFPEDPHSPCGMRVPCPHCQRVMASITVDRVADAVAIALHRSQAHGGTER